MRATRRKSLFHGRGTAVEPRIFSTAAQVFGKSVGDSGAGKTNEFRTADSADDTDLGDSDLDSVRPVTKCADSEMSRLGASPGSFVPSPLKKGTSTLAASKNREMFETKAGASPLFQRTASSFRPFDRTETGAADTAKNLCPSAKSADLPAPLTWREARRPTTRLFASIRVIRWQSEAGQRITRIERMKIETKKSGQSRAKAPRRKGSPHQHNTLRRCVRPFDFFR